LPHTNTHKYIYIYLSTQRFSKIYAWLFVSYKYFSTVLVLYFIFLLDSATVSICCSFVSLVFFFVRQKPIILHPNNVPPIRSSRVSFPSTFTILLFNVKIENDKYICNSRVRNGYSYRVEQISWESRDTNRRVRNAYVIMLLWSIYFTSIALNFAYIPTQNESILTLIGIFIIFFRHFSSFFVLVIYLFFCCYGIIFQTNRIFASNI